MIHNITHIVVNTPLDAIPEVEENSSNVDNSRAANYIDKLVSI
jgi:hypothetical protein